ncbi:hypothetical protein TKK_0008817 [Trichogramma kaykai]
MQSTSSLSAAAASKAYVDALTKIGRQAQLGTWGGSQDVGTYTATQRNLFSDSSPLFFSLSNHPPTRPISRNKAAKERDERVRNFQSLCKVAGV